MYERHYAVKTPSNTDARIWRFMDLSSFISVLAKRALYFSKANETKDPYECLPSQGTLEHYRVGEDVQSNLRAAFVGHLKARACALINCWHMNEYESAAMWKLYLKSDEGVAIETTVSRLRDSFDVDREHITYIGQVEYADYEHDEIPLHNIFYTFLYKRRSFEHEKELRAFIWDSRYEAVHKGIYVPVDVKMLIRSVFVSPVAPSWFCEVVKSVAAKYDIDESRVKQSDLYRLVYPGEISLPAGTP